MFSPEKSVFISILLCIGGACVASLINNRRAAGIFSFIVTVCAATLVYYASFVVLSHGSGNAVTFLSNESLGFALRIHVDGISACFLILAATIAVPALLFSIRYMDHYQDYSPRGYYPFILLFLAAMFGLLSTTDMMWFFFIFWQMMTIPGYALIRYESRKPENKKAANKFMYMMQAACFITMLGAGIIAGHEMVVGGEKILKYDFEAVQNNIGVLLKEKPILTQFAFMMFLIGFGIKLGMWPFGRVWLPDAHPAAPSPVSAMLSGVMIKTGVYGIIRYFLWLVPQNEWRWFPYEGWGIVISVLGTITLFTGTFSALKQEQTKRLLAFHSIGQVGYILLGIGIALTLADVQNPQWVRIGSIALLGAIFHVFNHGVFKALLFLNAGSILYKTNTQDLNRLGGLMRIMPITGLTALIASFSISGVPPLNGFASKWTIFIGSIYGGYHSFYLPLLGVIAILTSGLTLASFIKFFGSSFLSGKPRDYGSISEKTIGGDVCSSMLIPQIFLATLCIVFGLFPWLGISKIHEAFLFSTKGFGGLFGSESAINGNAFAGVSYLQGASIFSPILIASFMVIFGFISFVLIKSGEAQRRKASSWLCGYVSDETACRYTAHNFYGELKRVFKTESEKATGITEKGK